jgi:hypothetical protein
MARKTTERYVRYYTFGSAAAKLDRDARRATLPKYHDPAKRKPLAVDPVSVLGSAVAVLLAILMVVGMIQVSFTAKAVREAETQVAVLQQEQKLLREKYESSYDLDQVRISAESMGMIPAGEATHVQIRVPAQSVEVQTLSWWDTLVANLRQFFA